MLATVERDTKPRPLLCGVGRCKSARFVVLRWPGRVILRCAACHHEREWKAGNE